MKTKLLIGLSSIGLAAGFWACGDGTVEPMNEATDGYVKAMLETQSIDFATQVSDAKKKCSEDIACMNEMAKANNGAIETETSASTVPESSSGTSTPVSSSSKELFRLSSGGGDIGVQSSSSAGPQIVPSSSSETGPTEGLGSCYATPNPAEIGETVTWSVKWGTGVSNADKFSTITYNWTLTEDATPATSTAISATASYATRGTKAGSVSVAFSTGNKGKIDCTPMTVNGAKITGCTCTSVLLTPDVAAGESAMWKATGCTSTAAITGYVWKGATADETGLNAAAAVAEKDQEVKGVSFTVTNADERSETVTCENAKAIDSRVPDYEIKVSQGKVSLPAAGDYTVVVSSGGNITQCRMSAQAENKTSVTINSVTVEGQYYIPMGNNGVVDNSWCNSSLKVTVTGPITLEAAWN